MTRPMEEGAIRILTDEELNGVSGGTENLLKDIPLGISPAMDAFLGGYYNTCGCSSTGHSPNWKG
jgi:hypothetical protein